jgi:hypothetical protein
MDSIYGSINKIKIKIYKNNFMRLEFQPGTR